METTGTAEQGIAACAGDDAVYDYNAFAASLAVAIANELERWAVQTDFEVLNGKLELSATGAKRCEILGRSCANIKAMLRLQDDAASVVPNHSPSIYRSKLTSWHQTQAQVMQNLVASKLTMDKGVYRLKARHSGKYMVVDGGSYNDNAAIEQRGSVWESGADQWRLILQNTKHVFKNVRSGKCLSLATDSANDMVQLVQQTCSSTASTQQFEVTPTGGYYGVRTKHLKALDVPGASHSDDVRLIQYTWNSAANQHWSLEPVGSGPHVSPLTLAPVVYTMKVRHSGRLISNNNDMLEGSQIEQKSSAYADNTTWELKEDRYHWYITQVGTGNAYQFVNRMSGKCMALAADSPTSPIVQKTCSTDSTQLFALVPTGDGFTVVYTKYGRTLEVQGATFVEDTPMGQADGSWANHRMFQLAPVLAGAAEPHRLRYSHVTDDANCGEHNFWYEITQPNGQALRAPKDTFAELVFAGGKQSLTGADINPFIAQQISGNLVAIDPTYGLNESSVTTSGACAAACTKFSTSNIAGTCCSCNGNNRTFKMSAFSTSLYLCQ